MNRNSELGIHCLRGLLYRIDNLLIPRTAAHIGVNSFAYLLAVGVLILKQQRIGRKNHPRGTKTALNCPGIDKRLLNRMQGAVGLLEALDSGNSFANHTAHLSQTGAAGGVINQYGTRTASSGAAAVLSPG